MDGSAVVTAMIRKPTVWGGCPRATGDPDRPSLPLSNERKFPTSSRCLSLNLLQSYPPGASAATHALHSPLEHSIFRENVFQSNELRKTVLSKDLYFAPDACQPCRNNYFSLQLLCFDSSQRRLGGCLLTVVGTAFEKRRAERLHHEAQMDDVSGVKFSGCFAGRRAHLGASANKAEYPDHLGR